MQSSDSSEWLHAMAEELDALQENETWYLVPLPPGKRASDNRWVLRIKSKSDGSIYRYRARLVTRGVFQREGLDYDETFSPAAQYDSIRALIVTAAIKNLVLGQFDICFSLRYNRC